CSRNATELPLGDRRGWLIQPVVSNSTVPTGNSRRERPSTNRTTSSLLASADQSASLTFSSTDRGTAPSSGTRARVPTNWRWLVKRLSSDTASSPVDEMQCRCVWRNPSDLDSGKPARVENNSTGSPSQAAL